METQRTILDWGFTTFGESEVLDILVRANIEMAELVSAVQCGAELKYVEKELADVDIVCCQAAEILGVSADIATPAKENSLTPTRWAMGLNCSLADLMEAVSLNARTELLGSLLESVYYHLRQLAATFSVDLQVQRDEKMKINRARSWGRTPEGHFQHT